MLADRQVMNDDFYRYVKSDTLKGLNWICGDEGGGSAACNGGVPPHVYTLTLGPTSQGGIVSYQPDMHCVQCMQWAHPAKINMC